MLQDHSKRPPQQHDVQPHAPVADVPRIHLDPFVVGGVAAAVHLPHAGDAGMDHVEIFDIWAVFGDFSSDDGPGAHQAHLTDEYIEQLGQFVQAGLPQHPSYSCDPGILFQLEFSFPLFPGFRIVFQVFFQPLVCIHTHGPELQAGEQFPILADPLVSENDRARGIQLDQEGQQQEDRNQKDTADNGEYQIKDPFDSNDLLNGQGKRTYKHNGQPTVYEGNFIASFPAKNEIVGLNKEVSFADWSYKITKVETQNSAGNKQAAGKYIYVTMDEKNNGQTSRQPGSNNFFVILNKTNGQIYRMDNEAILAYRLATRSYQTPWYLSRINPGLSAQGIIYIFDIPKNVELNNLLLLPRESIGTASPVKLGE